MQPDAHGLCCTSPSVSSHYEIIMNTKKAEKHIQDTAQAVADKIEDGVERSREAADQALAAADAKVHHLRDDIQPAIDAVVERTRDLADQSQAALEHTRDQARERLHQAHDWTSDRMAAKPLATMALAAAAGAALALLLGRKKH